MKSILTIFFLGSIQIGFAQLYAPGSVLSTSNSATNNVGIGTSDPQSNLHISKANTSTSLLLENTASNTLAFPGINVTNYGGATSGHPFINFNNAQGTKTAPTPLNTLLGALIFSGHNGVNFVQSARIEVYPDAPFTSSSSATKMIFSTTTPNSTTYSEKMRITSTGNVGIGTTNPGSYKLAVEGKVGAREFNITEANPWPDYVFEKNYNLPTLFELEAFINQNKHLPEVPDACAVKENGINLGEINVLLMKKIEELTLYMIEMKKEIGAQQKEIDQLKKKK